MSGKQGDHGVGIQSAGNRPCISFEHDLRMDSRSNTNSGP